MKNLKFLLLLLLVSCNFEPQYSTPKSPVVLESGVNSVQIPFDSFFQSQKMRHIIQLAIDNNKDISLALLNIETAIETFNVKRADIFPTFSLNTSDAMQGVPSGFTSFTPKNVYRANLSLSAFEIDVFGRLRSLKKVAKQNLLATQMAQNVVKSSIVSQTANAYLQLIADANSLEIIKNAILEQERKVQILNKRKENGRALEAEIIAEEIALENMKSSGALYQKLKEQDLHTIMLLTGEFDAQKLEPYFKNVEISSIKIDEKLLVNIPSSVLLQRPDIQQAELKLKAANANIGAARAAFFPVISLTTGTFGYTSRELSSLFQGQAWALSPQISTPIFNAGRNRANLNIAKVQKKIEIVNYEKAIQTAFREFLDASTNHETAIKQVQHAKKIEELNKRNWEILQKQRDIGTTDSITLSNATIKLLQARQTVVLQEKEQFASVVVVYRAMGFAN